MSNDAATKKSTAAKSGRRPASKPASTRDAATGAPVEADAPPEPQRESAAGSSSERAQEMRAALGARQEAETFLAEASQLRQRAAADADSMVADAEQMAGELVSDATKQAERLVADAQARADEILGNAQAEADELHRNTESERARIEGVLSEIEAALRSASLVLTGAGSTISDVLGSLDRLQVGAAGAEAGGSELATVPTGPQEVASPAPEYPVLERVPTAEGGAPLDGEDARPLGWLFRNGQG